MPVDIHPERTVELTTLDKGERSRLRSIVGWILLASLIGGCAIYAAKSYADHDDRDPNGICVNHAQVAAAWAAKYRDEGKTKAETEKIVAVSPEQLENVPEKYRKLVIQHTVKGIEIVFDSTPQKSPQEVLEAFYEWCLPTLPKGPEA